ncbi:MAG: tetraacyldisaccharide 4'-kinase [Nitrospirota bacterium]|nr:tetraacyldisaccharide 4'-kinase [Nitrospirota bacterium]
MAKTYPILLFPLLLILSGCYGTVVRIRLWLYAQGWVKRYQLPCPVWSIGNVTVGGTGKTPITLWVAQQLINKGLRVGILSRGYRRSSQERFLLVSDGKRVLVDPSESGDEPFLMARRCPRAVVAVGADRHGLGKWVLQQQSVDCFVLDDGFQHVGLQRDVDLVLIDSSDTQGLERLLPCGRLREPLDGLTRATTIMMTRYEDGQDVTSLRDIPEDLKRLRSHVVKSRFVIEGLVMAGSNDCRPATGLSSIPVVIFSGIANPPSFRRMIEMLGVEIVDEVVYPDHHSYTPADLAELVQRGTEVGAQCFLTTEKDLVKIEATWSLPQMLYAVRIGLDVREGIDVLEACVQKVLNRCLHQKA